MTSPPSYTVWVCPECGHWVPARSQHSFFVCDGADRFGHTAEGYYKHDPAPHEPKPCDRLTLLPASTVRGAVQGISEVLEELEDMAGPPVKRSGSLGSRTPDGAAMDEMCDELRELAQRQRAALSSLPPELLGEPEE